MNALSPVSAEVSSLLARSPYTQREAARILEMSPQSLNDRLNGRTRWSADELPAVADLLGVSVADLYDAEQVSA